MSEHEHELHAEGAERRLLHSDDLMYRRVRAEVANTVWAMHPGTLAVLVDLLNYRAHGHRLSAEEVHDRISAARPTRATQTEAGAVAVLPLSGVIAHRSSAFEGVSSPNGTSVEAFTQMFRAAMADPSVGSIMIEIESPGGSVAGVPELGTEIRRARGSKPIIAFANTSAASAAYWIASAADEIVVAPSGAVGSIGVYSAHQDLSGALEQEGVKITLISAGKFKVEGNPFEPLSEEARADWQATVDGFYSMFVDAVAKGRGVGVADVRGGFGQGRMVYGQDAVAAGMADRVDTFENTIARLQRGDVAASRARAEEPQLSLAETWTPASTSTAAAAGRWHYVGDPGEPEFANGVRNAPVSSEDREPAEPELVEVEGADRLLGRKAVRELFAPAATVNEGGQ